jgi:hypothetical protein
MSNNTEGTIAVLALVTAYVAAAVVLGLSTIFGNVIVDVLIGAGGLYGVSRYLHHPQPMALKVALFGGISALVTHALFAAVGGVLGWLLGVLIGAAACIGLILLAMNFWPTKSN